jgi:Ni,Fe-hydrogenase III component G
VWSRVEVDRKSPVDPSLASLVSTRLQFELQIADALGDPTTGKALSGIQIN